jgi:chorismate mutase
VEKQKIEAMESEIQRLRDSIAQLNFTVMSLESKLSEIAQQIAPKKVKSEGVGIPVWESYRKAFMAKYRFEPIRNAKVNRNCADLAKRLGADAASVADFYVTKINDPAWVRLNHPISILLMHCESVHAMWRKGGMVSTHDARVAERRSENIGASRDYLAKKHGGTDETW